MTSPTEDGADFAPNTTAKKFEIEAALKAETEEIRAGRLKDENPLDLGEDFRQLCEASRRGDLKVCQEKIQAGVNINARDAFDYTPLILASLCGHFEVVQVLLEAGALCERDTFQGERALYNALNDRIRNLLLSYDYSKSRDPLQPLAAHITSLLHRDSPHTSDITLSTDEKDFHLHKFLLSARSPYFAKKLAAAPETTSWRVPPTIPTRSLEVAVNALYFSEVSLDLSGSEEDQALLAGIEKLGRQLEIGDLLEAIFESDRRKARQRRTEEVEQGRDRLDTWFKRNIVDKQVHVDARKKNDIKWDRQNSIFADVLLCASEEDDEVEAGNGDRTPTSNGHTLFASGIPVGPSSASSSDPTPTASQRSSRNPQAMLVPGHRAMLLRSDYFLAMFSSGFREAQAGEHLPIVHVDCSPPVLLIILSYLYTERCFMPLVHAVPTLFAADMLFIDRLKVQAATIISTLGNGSASVVEAENPRGEIVDAAEEAEIDIYDVVRAGWDTRMHRLEEFGARYIAYRLERFIDQEEFKELVRESAARIKSRQETDTVELIDDIRYYLSDRYRLRFEDTNFEDLIEEGQQDPSKHQTDDLNVDGLSIKDVDQNGFASELGAGTVRTLDGEIVGDEFAQDAMDYQILLGKIDQLLETLDLDA